MRPAPLRLVVVAGVVAALAGCGDEPHGTANTTADAPHAERAHVTVAPSTTGPSARVAALAAAYAAALDLPTGTARDAAGREAMDAIVAAGADGARALLLVASDDGRVLDETLIGRIGVAALEPLCEALDDPRTPVAEAVVAALREIPFAAVPAPLRTRLLERLVAVTGAYEGGSDDPATPDGEIAADEARVDASLAALGFLAAHPTASAPYAADVAGLIVRWWRLDADVRAADEALSFLRKLGPEAAPALAILLDAAESSEGAWPGEVLLLAERVGSAAPDELPRVAAYLEHDEPRLRVRAAHAVSAFGEPPAAVRARLVLLLDDPEERVRMAAEEVLARTPANVPAIWRRLLRADAEPEDADWARWNEHCMIRNALGRDGLAATIRASLPELSPSELRALAYVAAGGPPGFEDAVVAHLARHADSEVRAAALRAWSRWPAAPPEAEALLRDAAEAPRFEAARLVHEHGSPDLQQSARRALAAALASGDAARRAEAVRTLAYDGTPLPPVPRDALRRLADEMLDDPWSVGWTADVLVRCEGGVEELCRVLRPRLGPAFDPDRGGLAVVDALEAMGPAAAPLRDVIASTRPQREGAYVGDLACVLHAIDGDAMAYVEERGRGWGEHAGAVLSMGPDGPRAAVLHLGLQYDDAPRGARPPLDDATSPELDAATVAAAAVRDGEHAVAWRRGAACLLPRLPASRSVPLLVQLLRDDDAGVRSRAVVALGQVARKRPEAVPLDAVAAALRDPATRRTALDVVRALGGHARDLAADVRRVAVDGTPAARVEAAALLPSLGATPDDAADLVRAVLRDAAHVAWDDEGLWDVRAWAVWDAVRDAFLAAPPDETDVALLLGARPVPARVWAAVLARLGPAAAPAVPRLRRLLADEGRECEVPPYGETDPDVEAAARALAAIGPAAVCALPDLRRAAAVHGDFRGVLGDAIRTLEAAR